MRTDNRQLSINYTPGLTDRFPTAKSVVAYAVHTFGLVRMATALNKSHGELSKLLTDERHLDVDLADEIMDIADSDLLADWHIERRKARASTITPADVARKIDEMRDELTQLAMRVGK